MSESFSLYDPRNNSYSPSEDFIQLRLWKDLTFQKCFYPRNLQKEVYLREKLDQFACALANTETVSIYTLAQKGFEASNDADMWKMYFYIFTALKSGQRASTDSEMTEVLKFLDHCLQVEASYTEIEAIHSFEENEMSFYRKAKINTIRMFLQGTYDLFSYFRDKQEYASLSCICDLAFLSTPLCITDLFDRYLADTEILTCVSDDTRRDILQEITEYFSDYSDDVFIIKASQYLMKFISFCVSSNKNIDLHAEITRFQKLFQNNELSDNLVDNIRSYLSDLEMLRR